MPDDEESEIEVVPAVEAVRRRPEMYMGPLDDPGIGNCFIIESLCTSFDQVVAGKCTQIKVTVDGNRISVEDNGPGLSMRRLPNGLVKAEVLMTALFACRHMKEHQVIGENFCRGGMAVVNALSSQCTVDNRTDGRHWQQTYQRGIPEGPFEDLGNASQSGFAIQLMPDHDLIPSPVYDVDALTRWLSGLTFESGQAELTILEQSSGKCTAGQLRNGTFSFDRS